MKTLTQVTCRRCNGSGNYSFNLLRGTVCFGCEGSGFQMVDAKKEEAKKVAAAKRQATQEASREKVIAATKVVKAELNAIFGNKFNIETELGTDLLNKAVGEKFKKSIWMIRDERLAV